MTVNQGQQSRNLNADNIQGIASALARFTGQHVEAVAETSDAEAFRLAQQIVIALEYAHWDVEPHWIRYIAENPPRSGVIVYDRAESPIAEAIVLALREQRLETSAIAYPGQIKERAVIRVYSNPIQ